MSADPSPDAGPGLVLTASPNPARNQTTLHFHLGASGPDRLVLFDALGRTVADVAEGERAAGEHTVTVDTSRLPAGVYLARLDAGGRVETWRITVVR